MPVQTINKIQLHPFQLDVKTTSNGGITITTKTNGTLQLTTVKKHKPTLAKPSGNGAGMFLLLIAESMASQVLLCFNIQGHIVDGAGTCPAYW